MDNENWFVGGDVMSCIARLVYYTFYLNSYL